jgi:hypothetical protein
MYLSGMAGLADDVCFRGHSGSRISAPSGPLLTQQRQFTSFRDRQMMHCGIGILFLSGTQSLMLRFDSGEAFARAAL